MKDSRVNSDGTSTNRTSLALLERVRRNDRAAWEQMVRLYTPLVYHWCRLAGLQSADVEEVGQEVFVAVLKGLARFSHEGTGATFRGWLRTVTRSKIADHFAARGAVGCGGSSAQDRLAGVPAPDPGDDAEAQAEEKYILYRRAIELMEVSFEPATRRAFWLLLAGRTAKEVAAELGISPSAVYTAKSKILARLRDEFGDVLDLGPTGFPAPPPRPQGR